MGLQRGTVLGLTGIAGALLERDLNLVGSFLLAQFGLGPFPAVISWILGCFVGVVAGDIVTALTDQEVNLGRWAGIKKGVLASLVAAIGFYASTTGMAGDLLGEYLAGVSWLAPGDTVKLGSIWLGCVLGDFFDA